MQCIYDALKDVKEQIRHITMRHEECCVHVRTDISAPAAAWRWRSAHQGREPLSLSQVCTRLILTASPSLPSQGRLYLGLIRQNQKFAYDYEYGVAMPENQGEVDNVMVAKGFNCEAERAFRPEERQNT